MSRSGMLQDKHAVVFGGGGSIGAAVAKELASEGAEVFLAGRSPTTVDLAAKQITAAGGRAHSDVVDALDAAAVDGYLEAVVRQAGSIDIEFNATGPRISEHGHGKPVLELAVDEFMTPVATVLLSQFITARGGSPDARAGVRRSSSSPRSRHGSSPARQHIGRLRRGPKPSCGPWRSNSALPGQGGLPADHGEPGHADDPGHDRSARQDAEHHARASHGPPR